MNPQTKRQELAGLEAYCRLKSNDVIEAATKIATQRIPFWCSDEYGYALKELQDSVASFKSVKTRIDLLKQMIQVAEEEVQRLLTPSA